MYHGDDIYLYTRAGLDHGSKIPKWYSFQNSYELSILSDPQVTWKCIPNPPGGPTPYSKLYGKRYLYCMTAQQGWVGVSERMNLAST